LQTDKNNAKQVQSENNKAFGLSNCVIYRRVDLKLAVTHNFANWLIKDAGWKRGALAMDSNRGSIPSIRKKKALHKLISAASETKDGVTEEQSALPRPAPTLEDIREALLRREG